MKHPAASIMYTIHRAGPTDDLNLQLVFKRPAMYNSDSPEFSDLAFSRKRRKPDLDFSLADRGSAPPYELLRSVRPKFPATSFLNTGRAMKIA